MGCKDNSAGAWFGSFGQNFGAALGIPTSVMAGSVYQHRMEALNDLQAKYKSQMQSNIVQYCRVDSEIRKELYNVMDQNNKALQETCKYNDLIIKNNLELDQIEIVGIYALFMVIYLYLILL